MANDQSTGGPTPDQTEDRASTSPRPPRARRWGPIVLAAAIVGPLLLFAVWITLALHWHYSVGTRAGYIQKFSEKGWLCKTWEGELAMVNLPGAAQERFLFSVRDDSVAREVTRLMGGHVKLKYEEHRGVPTSCFGDTQYYVNGVERIP